MKRLTISLALLGPALVLLACAREPIDRVCPDLLPGDLVITELRGKQSGADSYGQWIELYNAADRPIELGGVVIELRRLTGAGDYRFMVRDPDLTVEPGEYVVLGGLTAEGKAHVDYSYSGDLPGDLYAAAFIDLYTCGELVDGLFYRALPALGTYSLDGAQPPDAARNDDPDGGAWCTDDAPPAPGEPVTELGIRGTPGEANRPCP